MTPDLVERVIEVLRKHIGDFTHDGRLSDAEGEEDATDAARAAIAIVLEEAAKVAEKATPRAHTYASENADVYRAYDKGAWDAIKAIRALKGDE